MPAFVRVHEHVYACVYTNFVFENIHLDDHAISRRQVGFGGGVEAFHAMEVTISVRRTNKGAEMYDAVNQDTLIHDSASGIVFLGLLHAWLRRRSVHSARTAAMGSSMHPAAAAAACCLRCWPTQAAAHTRVVEDSRVVKNIKRNSVQITFKLMLFCNTSHLNRISLSNIWSVPKAHPSVTLQADMRACVGV